MAPARVCSKFVCRFRHSWLYSSNFDTFSVYPQRCGLHRTSWSLFARLSHFSCYIFPCLSTFSVTNRQQYTIYAEYFNIVLLKVHVLYYETSCWNRFGFGAKRIIWTTESHLSYRTSNQVWSSQWTWSGITLATFWPTAWSRRTPDYMVRSAPEHSGYWTSGMSPNVL